MIGPQRPAQIQRFPKADKLLMVGARAEPGGQVGLRELLTALVALLCLGLGLLLLEQPRTGLVLVPIDVGGTPATVMQVPGVRGPAVVIAHGFAGSRQLMQPIQLTLARAGYITVSYDLEGHGRNPQPMRGDVTEIEGTTRFLVDELLACDRCRAVSCRGSMGGWPWWAIPWPPTSSCARPSKRRKSMPWWRSRCFPRP